MIPSTSLRGLQIKWLCSEVEPNIHAGVKYMRWMIDQYYGKEPMTKLDKALFAFASYNAGAGRVSQLRKEAAKRGLDPNVWFRNVEYVAAEKIGAETVTYVANIYKYYIAYKLIMETRTEREGCGEDEGPEQMSFLNSHQSLTNRSTQTCLRLPGSSTVNARFRTVILALKDRTENNIWCTKQPLS
jgi:membrane-bound lytic murein transglycosylase MltF